MSAKASGAQPNGDSNAKSREHHDGSSGRAFTVEQKAAVLRVRKCKPTAFYDVLGLEAVKSTCTDAEIKKAYRKQSLLTHPDKNGYTGADEAFKVVSRAFQVLSDPDKRRQYDMTGGDPDSRFGGGGSAPQASPFSGFQRAAGGRGGGFEAEISPEELFRQFFAGGMGGPFGGGMFDTGPGFAFNMGPGVRVHQFGGGRPRARPQNAANNEPPPTGLRALQSLLPLLLLIVFPLLSSLFSGTGSATGPSVRFDSPMAPQTQQRISNPLKIHYWVDPAQVKEYGARDWRSLDKRAEAKYVNQLNYECEIEHDRRNKLVNNAQGFFFTDEAMMNRARQMEMRSCRRLNELGYRGV